MRAIILLPLIMLIAACASNPHDPDPPEFVNPSQGTDSIKGAQQFTIDKGACTERKYATNDLTGGIRGIIPQHSKDSDLEDARAAIFDGCMAEKGWLKNE